MVAKKCKYLSPLLPFNKKCIDNESYVVFYIYKK